MITCNTIGVNGRLGNQMFQYATLFSVAKMNGFDFGIPFQRKSENEFYHLFLPEGFKNLTAKDSSFFQPQYFLREEKFEYDERIFSLPDNTDLWGYFQTEKYFKQYKNDILNEFTFNEDIKNKCTNFINETNSELKEMCSIHLRLGDYLIVPDAHPTCTKQYYLKSLENISKNCLIYIFSDDIENCKQFFNGLNITNKVVYSTLNNNFLDMCLMSMCHYHIIANSSFSWWGAWLANSKQVIAPSTWFGPKIQKNWTDIYCDNWIVI